MLRKLCPYIIIIILLSDGFCKEVAYSVGDLGGHPLGNGNLTEYNGSDIVISAIAGANQDSKSILENSKTLDEIKKEINLKLNIGNPSVRDEGLRLILEYPGDGTISQICSIYDYMVGNWSYARDPHGIDLFQYSNKSLDLGKGKFSGQGDCDDFSILLASLIESIGVTSRIMVAYGPMGGHAYTEVYLGKAEGIDSDVDRMIKWLMTHYNVGEINTHTNLDTGDVWLNLDWWKDPNTGTELARHPGGPFFEATKQTPIFIKEDILKSPPKPLNNPPIAQFLVSSNAPNLDETVTFDASSSRDIGIGGEIERYRWNFGDEIKGEGKIVTHVYSRSGRYQVNLTLIDNDGAQNGTMQTVEVNALPIPIIDYQPSDPKNGDFVSFDASNSWDKEDGKVSTWLWEFGDGESSTKEHPSPHQFEMGKNYTINLTVSDKNHASNKTSVVMKINEPPAIEFSYSTNSARRYPDEGETMTFDASESKDKDGNITIYEWFFGDHSLPIEGKVATHSYATGGNFTVSLEVTDNNNATIRDNRTIRINWLPIARISPVSSNYLVDEKIIFDASNSSDNDSTSLTYLWDFDNDGILDNGAKRTAHAYQLSGQYRVKLIVTDENGASNSTYIDVSIEEQNGTPKRIYVSAPSQRLGENPSGEFSLTTLRQDSGKNYSDMDITLFSSLAEFGVLEVGEAVKFTAPKAGWKLQKVRVLGWSGYNKSTESFPADRNIMLEIRDKDLNLLYKFVDAQNNYFLSDTGPLFGEIEIPAVAVTGDFYVVFYDHGAAPIGMENSDGTGNSFLFANNQLQPADRIIPETNETVKINWLMEAAGK